jgi:8-oxo-dGTP diphosphatase
MVRDITKVGLAIVEANHLLLVRKRGSSFYILPGGKPEQGEDDTAALCREIDEELGCRIDMENLVFHGSFSDEAAGVADARVTVKLYGGSLVGTPTPESEIEELLWFCPEMLQRVNLAPSLKNSIIPFLFCEEHLTRKRTS